MGNDSGEELSLSDWITFLTSEKNSNLGNIFNLSALLFVALAIILPTATHNNWLSLLIFGAILIWMFYKLGPFFARRAEKAGKLLDRIMSGELTNPSEIQKEWKESLNIEKQKAKKKPREPLPATEKKGD
jgi:hypothetical protein